jgi:hypothetical protein
VTEERAEGRAARDACVIRRAALEWKVEAVEL